MEPEIKVEEHADPTTTIYPVEHSDDSPSQKSKLKNIDDDGTASSKRRCVSTACIACRRRKSKCDGNLPACAACASVYLTPCEYAPHTDHRRKGVYKKDIDHLKTKNSTLQTLLHAILNYDEEDAFDLVRQIRASDNLEIIAESINSRERTVVSKQELSDSLVFDGKGSLDVPQFETELSNRMGDLLLDGSIKFIGGTSNLLWSPQDARYQEMASSPIVGKQIVHTREEAILSWTTVTGNKEHILHLINMYFCWHYAYFTTLSKELFYRDFLQGVPSQYCSKLLVNVMLALGCHFSTKPFAKADPDDSSTTGDHFFKEAKKLLHEDDELTNAQLCTIQALALMSVREAGCGRETQGWVYSGMSFRMALDLGLNIDAQPINEFSKLQDEDIDARRVTFWGCYLFDKCWSNYLGRQPQLQLVNITTKKPDVFGYEEAEMWSPYTDSGIVHNHAQPARTRAVALQISNLAEISSDLLTSFYDPILLGKASGKQSELKKLSDIHTRLEAWKRDLPPEMEAKEGQLPQVLLMHMFYQLLYIHLYRPFLKYTRATSPLPSHVSPRKYCTQAAGAISKLFRLYKRIHGLRQICNIAVYIIHSACTIHLLNLPDKNAKRDIVHGLKHLEEMGECWTCARRTLRVLNQCADKWDIEVPDEAMASFARCRTRWGSTDPSVSPASNTVLAAHALMFAQPAVGPPPQSIQPLIQQPRSRQIVPSSIHPASNGFAPESYSTPSHTVDIFRSSRGLPLPPQSAADLLSRGDLKSRTTIPMHQPGEGLWNAKQDPRRIGNNITSANTWPSTVSYSTNPAPAQFTGSNSGERNIANLLEDNQDWWFRDQNSLAMGFENWTDMDWSNFSNDVEANAAANNRIRTSSSQQFPPRTDGLDFGFDGGPDNSGNNTQGIQPFDSGGGMGSYQKSTAVRTDSFPQQQQYYSSSHRNQ